MSQNLPLELKEPFDPPPKWEIAAQILAFNGYKKGISKGRGAFALAAATVGIHKNTLYLWTLDDRFIELVEQQEAKLVTMAVQGLTKMFKDNVAACHCVLQNILPNKWDPRIRLEKLKAQLQSKIQKELQAGLEPLPIPVYESAGELPDPDGGQRPAGYQEFIT